MRRVVRHVGLGLVGLALAAVGCLGPHRQWTDNLVWSPDGTQAIVLASDLYLSDRAGHVTPLHSPDAYRVAWTDDSRSLVIARSRKVSTFADVASALGAQRAEAVAADAERLWLILRGPNAAEYLSIAPIGVSLDTPAVYLYLRDHYADELRARFPGDWPGIEDLVVDLHSLNLAHLTGDGLVLDATLYQGLTPIKTIRLAPGMRMVAIVTKDDTFLSDSTVRILVMPTGGAASATLVAEHTNTSPDWTPDGRSLVYFSWQETVGSPGCLRTHDVTSDPPGVSSCLAEVMFDEDAVVRCLPDGRVLFDAREVHFPGAAQVSQRIVVDGKTQVVVVRQPWGDPQVLAIDRLHPGSDLKVVASGSQSDGGIAFYEVSHDRNRLLYGTRKGDISLMALGDGQSELQPLGLHREAPYTNRDLPVAVWTGPDAFTYLKRIGARNEYVVRQGRTETVLSRQWPADLLWPYPDG